ncbi:MAG: hypothetical protein M1820_005182 [Bogoriella megaspora]|nr:MAG: hypothetical protein M1820_005182 [Bogoriella megaspora]
MLVNTYRNLSLDNTLEIIFGLVGVLLTTVTILIALFTYRLQHRTFLNQRQFSDLEMSLWQSNDGPATDEAQLRTSNTIPNIADFENHHKPDARG